MVLRIVENIFLPSILHKYDLCWHFLTTYFEVIVAATLWKSPQSKWYLNEAMASGCFAPRKAKNCKQHDLFVLPIYIYIYIYIYTCNVATYKTIKRTELTTVKLLLPFETHNLFTIMGWVGRS